MTVTPQIADRRARRINMRKEKSISNRPQVYNLLLKPLKNNDGNSDQYPANILLLRPEPRRPEQSSLFLNRIPVPREKWHYDTKDKVIRWKGLYGGGEIFLSRKERGGLAKVGKPGLRIPLRVTSRVSFLCDVALNNCVGENCSVERASIGENFASLVWYPESDEWQNAQWDEDRLLLSYSVTFEPGQVGVLSPIEFEDLKRNLITNPWRPNAPAIVDLVETPDQGNQWTVSFENGAYPELPGDGYDTQFQKASFPAPFALLNLLEIPSMVLWRPVECLEKAPSLEFKGSIAMNWDLDIFEQATERCLLAYLTGIST